MTMNEFIESLTSPEVAREKVATVKKKPLLQLLDHLDSVYRTPGEEPLVSDAVYDALYSYGESKYGDDPFFAREGVDTTALQSDVSLPFYMSSRDQVDEPEDVQAWLADRPKGCSAIVVAQKLDGWAATLAFDGGEFSLAATQGKTGKVGKDVTAVVGMAAFPHSVPGDLTIRAELILPRSVEALVRGSYKGTLRNVLSGMLGRSKNVLSASKHIEVRALQIYGSKQTYGAQLQWLKDQGFHVPLFKVIPVEHVTFDLLQKLFKQVRERDHEADGLVLTYDVVPPAERSGNPAWSIKFKNGGEDSIERVTVTVENVTYAVGAKRGAYEPTIWIKPTMIGGVLVSSFAGFNGQFIKTGVLRGDPPDTPIRPIGKGAVLSAVRAGDVIPYIAKVLKGAKAPILPASYEEVGANFVPVDGADTSVETEKYAARLEQCIKTLGVIGVGVAACSNAIASLVDAGYTPADAMVAMLNDSDGALWQKHGKMGKPAAKLARGIQAAIDVAAASGALGKMLAASSVIPGVAEVMANKLVDAVPELRELREADDYPNLLERIQAIPDFGGKRATVFVQHWNDFVNLCHALNIDEFSEPQVSSDDTDRFIYAAKRGTQPLAGKVVYLTGFRDPELAAVIEALGGEVKHSFGPKVNLLIAKDTSSGSTAKKRKTMTEGEVVSVDDFYDRMQDVIDRDGHQ